MGNAANLVINGGTLRYTGATDDSTDRLLTVGSNGATIEVTGTGSVTFGSAGGTHAAAGTAARALTLGGTNAGANILGGDLVNGTGTLSVTKTGSNTWNLTGTHTFTGGINVNGGTLGVKKINANGNVSVAAGAKLQLGPGNAISDASLFGETTNKLTLTGTGTLDVNKSGAVFDYDTTSLEATIRTQIVSGFNNGTWTGTGITSAAAAADTKYAVGYASAADLGGGTGGTLLNQAYDATSVVVAYTLKGDSNLDGTVNFSDLLALAANYNGTPNAWAKGDSNYDGAVNFSDLLALAANYNATASSSFAADWALAQSMVPEPTTPGLLGAISLLTLGRRRRD
ncbi:MAG: PEP-CTERM sorting domain-containing protein [Tepidisphaeraceae bacterium]